MAMSGEKPEKGVYECIICGFQMDIEEGEEICTCPLCSGVNFKKI